MNLGFWAQLKSRAAKRGEPLFVLAPMADVTDASFRRVIAKHSKMGTPEGGPDVMWTEFVSADGLCRATPEGKSKLMKDLIYDESERPIVAQLFSSRPEMMEQAAKLVTELGFDGIDINMGCPDKGIEKQGAGAAMIKDPKRAQEVIAAAKRGAEAGAKVRSEDESNKAGKPVVCAVPPVTVKTRIGYNKNELDTWLPAIFEAEPAVVTIHCRTRKEMSKVPARWEHVREAVEMRDKIQAALPPEARTLIFGNGDIKDLNDARAKAKETGADGVMLGRAIFGNPWLFNRATTWNDVPLAERLRVMVEHTKLFQQILGDTKNFALMKKHYKAYVTGFDGANELRAKLMETTTAEQVETIVEEYLKTL